MKLRLPSLRLPRAPLGLRRWPGWRWRPWQLLGSPRHKRAAGGLALLFLCALWWYGAGGDGDRPTWPRAQILAAIRQVESSDRDDVPDGDGGKAIGPYQIHEVYWQDAQRADPGLGGTYQDCRQRAYAERVIAAYMQKWAADAWRAGDAETIARIHNGGPGGAGKDSTLGYWQRVRAHLP